MHVAFRVGEKWLALPCERVLKVTEVERIFPVPDSSEQVIYGDWGISQLLFVANRKPKYAVIFEESDRTYAFGADEISMDKNDVTLLNSKASVEERLHAE